MPRLVSLPNPTTGSREVRCISAWCRVYGIKRRTVEERQARNWPIHRAITEPVSAAHSAHALRSVEARKAKP